MPGYPASPSLQRWSALEYLIGEGFKYRRKSLLNALKSLHLPAEVFEIAKIDATQRAETLELVQWDDLLEAINNSSHRKEKLNALLLK